ncbi:uncharacterized protein NECHADRAFT_88232 [Fusarium vanettenii 77-13-4]|uniref:Heterokaryon incompatibility domain-containing protein n=1 Tax=Fusarium vanettenii (strain ATCC MYA-4622 / CBS 123669 / FGSC 9596 / NRRL 45880 / 77-13-4) TaxID=660122 RepID=C7ZDS1_FUSV7|nr:uncharacterized protein NECHADRAFT_88232 [Fusarium vanettenii 77-13-4]EEU37917.1 hypothetical protein NECHADRAFT_88232 [Fusarium vanettenii 77-13-4]
MAESTDPTTTVPNLYHPLDTDKHDLRLLEICPSENNGSQVQVKIFPCCFEDVQGQFIPLSYVWGDQTDTETIIINGIPKKVTKNLALFLRQIRSILPEILTSIPWEKPALFWADAICINQDDTEERNRQVQLMGSIYGSAPTVLAWLGEAQDSHFAANMANAADSWLNACDEKDPDGDRDPNFDGWMERHPDFWSLSGDVNKTNSYFSAVKTLLNSPYWQRTWTFQEITLPADTLLVHGSALIRLSSLEALTLWMLGFLSRAASDFSFLDRGTYRDLLMTVEFATVSVSYSIRSALVTREELATQERPTLALVPSLAGLYASDPRDKIFGLLGVVDTQLIADYSKPFIQVYCEFVSAWLLEVRDLNFLLDACRTRHREVQPGLPSWAPDWDAISQALNTDEDMVDVYPMGNFLHERDHQASARLLTDPAHLSQSSRILTATGVVCDEVEEVYPAWRDSKGSLAIRTSFFDLVQRHIDRSMLGGNCSRRHVFQALFRTALHDTCPVDGSGYSSPYLLQSDATKVHTWGICFLLYLALRYTAIGDPSAPDPDSIATTLFPRLGIPYGQDFSRFWREEIFGDMKLGEPDVPHWRHAPAALQWAMENHMAEFHSIRLHSTTPLETNVKFLTKNNYMGFSSSVEVGDKVVVLGGCGAPVLLRPKDGHYEHISACFVVDLMDGEAKDMLDRGEAKLETFEIH